MSSRRAARKMVSPSRISISRSSIVNVALLPLVLIVASPSFSFCDQRHVTKVQPCRHRGAPNQKRRSDESGAYEPGNHDRDKQRSDRPNRRKRHAHGTTAVTAFRRGGRPEQHLSPNRNSGLVTMRTFERLHGLPSPLPERLIQLFRKIFQNA